jgi:two-component system CheB/CheR fusion protein
VLRGIDSGLIVLDEAGCVHSWNRWSENAWGLREEEVLGHKFGELDIGLPVKQLLPLVQSTLAEHSPGETTLAARDRRGRTMLCRVRVSPLMNPDRSTQAAVILVEDHPRPSD